MKKWFKKLERLSSLQRKAKSKENRKKLTAFICVFVLIIGGFGPAGSLLFGHSLEVPNLKSERAEGDPEKEQHATPVVEPLGELVMGKDIVIEWEPIPTATNGYYVVLSRFVNSTVYIYDKYTIRDWQENTEAFSSFYCNAGDYVSAIVYALETTTHALSEPGRASSVQIQRGVPRIILNDQFGRLNQGTFELDYQRYGGGVAQFSSSDPSVATIDANGIVTPVGLGNTTITLQVLENSNFFGATASANLEIKNSHDKVTGINFEKPVAGQNLEITWDRIPSAEKGYILQYYNKNRKWKTKKIAQPESDEPVTFKLKGKELVKRKIFEVRIKAIETEDYLEAGGYAYSKRMKIATPPKPQKPQKPNKPN